MKPVISKKYFVLDFFDTIVCANVIHEDENFY